MSAQDKVMSLSEAVGRFVRDGDVLYLGGFVQHEPFSAGHEIIRQGRRDLTLSKCAGLILSDQLIGAGVVRHLITSFTWNPLPRTAHCLVRALTQGVPKPLILEEYSILALNLAYFAGAMGLPYVACKTMLGSDMDREWSRKGAINRLRFDRSPFTGERICLVPPIRHDVGIIQVQRADPSGNAQAWGMLGESRYGILSCEKIIVCAEEIVSPEVIMSDPSRTLIPGFRVQAVVEEPLGAHPHPMAGCYDMDWPFFAYYETQSRTVEDFQRFLKLWVTGVKHRKEYLSLLGEERVSALKPRPFASGPVPYGLFPEHPFEVHLA